jgi:hypothetical protein
MLTQEQKSKLNPEQLAIAEKWEREKNERSAILDRLDAGEIDAKEALRLMSMQSNGMCEHDRSIWSNCAACEEIERLLYPEAYCKGCDEHGYGELNQEGLCPLCSNGEQNESGNEGND